MLCGLILAALFQGPARAEEPSVQVLVPGFEVQALPVRLTNVNNLAFDPDGRLFALGYDGRVHRLVDTNDDGVEDAVEPFWDEPTLRVPVGLAWSPEGVYVSSHGKVSLLIDENGDGKADREEVIASGWPPTDVPSGGVDALGVTLDDEGNLYFGLGTADYSNPYRIKDGKSYYDINSERGTILKLAPDRDTREIIATGIRFPYALRFNRHGDLFATDQEGETWLPGGNPLDELNHIRPGRHYGFPPRHEEHLPDVIDEPPVVAFSPQHQSTCGMIFNDSKPGWKAFGPPEWEGDAFVTGFSRGKLWRVRLVKTPSGYVGRPTLFATSRLMVADVAVSPSGELYLTCHSGPPDWGSGPQGDGHLFKLKETDPSAPRPVVAWAANPLEVRVAFDQPLDPSVVEPLSGTVIPFGAHVRAADRFEVHKPPYQAVEQQQAAPTGTLRISAARLEDQGRTLVLATDPHPWHVTYAPTLPAIRAEGAPDRGAIVDLDYNLNGVEVTFEADQANQPGWSAWWPHLDARVARALTAGSLPHEQGFDTLDQTGRLTFQGALTFPEAEPTLRLEASGPIDATIGSITTRSVRTDDGTHQLEVWLAAQGEPLPLLVTVATGSGDSPFVFYSSYWTDADPSPRPLPLERLHMPWVPTATTSVPEPVAEADPGRIDLSGGDPRRGEAVFFSEQARCSACHTVRGQGAEIGPDLSNLVHRDAASVLRDINEPSATIHPDYVSYLVALKDGRVLNGLVRSEGNEALRVTDTDAQATIVPLQEVETFQPSASSIMPDALLDPLEPDEVRDLLAFLLTPVEAVDESGQPAPDEEAPAPDEPRPPPPRTRAEFKAALGEPTAKPESVRPLKVLLVAGPKDHGPGEHDYPGWQRDWQRLLVEAPGVRLDTANPWPDRDQWAWADLIVLYFWNHDWSAERYQDLDAFLARGGGVVALHAALIADTEPEALAQRFGLSAQPGRTRYRHGPLDLTLSAPDHPITHGLNRKQIDFVDETYWPLIGDPSEVEVLATAVEEGEPHPMLWTYQAGAGRVFASVLGHYAWTFEDALFRLLVLRGLAWAADEPPRRFDPLATKGIDLLDDR